MSTEHRQLLGRLGAGERIADLCAGVGWSRAQFDGWWQGECGRRVPADRGTVKARGLRGRVTIHRDSWGIPHIEASSDADLFFGFGYATAQDRLFQLDWVRRRACGRLAEIIGPEGVESDVLHRTLDLAGVARREEQTLPTEARDLLGAYCAGINALIEASGEVLPIEFDLLGYRPERWLPRDSLAVAGEFRWYLTGRFYVLAIPELVKQALGDGPLYRAFLLGEEDEESIVPPGAYPSAPQRLGVGDTISDRDAGHGSNNWVLAGERTASGKPLVASDPHVPFGAVSIWQEVRLRGGSFDVAGIAYAGVPGIMIGRNLRMAWGITNNICSLRDLYREKTDPAHPDCFLFDGKWEKASERRETIQVKGLAPVERSIVGSRNGPLVNELLPGPARTKEPIALRWLGLEPCGWLTALLAMNRARNVEEFREATRPWRVPTFNLVFADVDGRIGHQCVGRIPQRGVAERGYRPGWDPAHQWTGVLPFDAMPYQLDPPRGFVVTANHRLAPDDYPWPLFGTWSSGHRGRRIREELEARPRWTSDGCRELQLDVRSGRAAASVPALLAELKDERDPRIRGALDLLRGWDYRMTPASGAAAVFAVFFGHWSRAVTAARLPAEQVEFVSANVGGLAVRLLAKDEAGWFERGERKGAMRAAVLAAVEELTQRLGPDVKQWRWGRLHTLVQRHYLSTRGDLGTLLDKSGCPAPGDGTTVCSTSADANHAAHLGASYRMVADMSDPQKGFWAVHIPGSSGHPGSGHYGDQVEPWSQGRLHYLALDAEPAGEGQLILEGG